MVKNFLFSLTLRIWMVLSFPRETPHDGTHAEDCWWSGAFSLLHPSWRQAELTQAAKLLGWSFENNLKDFCQDGWRGPTTIAIYPKRLWLPTHCVLAGHSTFIVHIATSLQEAIWSWLLDPSRSLRNLQTKSRSWLLSRHPKEQKSPGTHHCFGTSRRRRLEIQVWRAYGNESDGEAPPDRLSWLSLCGLDQTWGEVSKDTHCQW